MPIRNTVEKVAFSSAARTSTATSETLSMQEYIEANLQIDITAASGTDETLQFAVQVQDDDSSSAWKYLAVGQRHYGTGTEVLSLANFGKQIRVQALIGGTSPSFTFKADVIGKT